MESDISSKKRVILKISSILLFISLWWFLSDVGVKIGEIATSRWPTPIEVIVESHKMLANNPMEVLHHSWASFYRVIVGFFVAAIVAIPLGLGIGTNRIIEDLTYPIVESLRPIPPLAWIPIILIAFGTRGTMFFITFIGAVFPIILNTISGVNTVRKVEVRAAKCLGANNKKIFKEIVLPKSLSNIFTGLAVGMGIAWICIVAAEMVAGNYGLGYYIWTSYNTLQYERVVFGMILLGILGYGCSALIRIIGDKVMPWRKYSEG